MMDYEGPESTNSSEQGKGKDTGRSLLLDEYSRAHRQMFHEQDGYPNQGQVEGIFSPAADRSTWSIVGSRSLVNHKRGLV